VAIDAELPRAQRERMLRVSFRMFVVSQFIVFFTLFSLRFVFSGTSTSPNANIWVGLVETVLVLAAGAAGLASLNAIRRGEAARSERNSLMASIYGFASVGLILYQWRSLDLVLTDHFAEAYYAVTGFWALYMFVAALLYYAMRVRNRRIPFTAENHWELEAVTTFLSVPVIAWIAILILMYIV
jgi:heme/copper-type cytochrome/quinol oxidase subunit 3